MHLHRNGFRGRAGIAAALAWAWAFAWACPAEPTSEAPAARYAERMVYDPQTRKWVREVPPELGTPDGDLARARVELASGKAREAGRHLDDWLARYSAESPRQAEAVYLRGRCDFEMDRLMHAHDRYQRVLNNWPGTEWAAQALRGELIIAEAFLAGRKRRVLGFLRVGAESEGLDILDDIIVNHPNQPVAEQALRAKADYYYRTGEFQLAEDAYAQLARDFPGGPIAREAMLQSAQAALASFPGVQFDDAALIEAEERFVQFQEAYPQYAADERIGSLLQDIQAKLAEKEFRIAEYYERVRRRNAAIYYYQLVASGWPETTWAGMARARLASLGVGTE